MTRTREFFKLMAPLFAGSHEPSKTLFQKFPQVVGFMTKPFKTEELLKTVQDAAAKVAG